MGQPINRAFLAKAIDKAQHLVIGDGFCDALNEYIRKADALFWDEARGLFWAKHPNDGMQVAVWLMPVATELTA